MKRETEASVSGISQRSHIFFPHFHLPFRKKTHFFSHKHYTSEMCPRQFSISAPFGDISVVPDLKYRKILLEIISFCSWNERKNQAQNIGF